MEEQQHGSTVAGPSASQDQDEPSLLEDENMQERPEAALSPIQDFAAFMDSIGLAPDWASMDFLDIDPVLQPVTVSGGDTQQPSVGVSGVEQGLTTFVPATSVPTTAEVNALADRAGSDQALTPIRWKVTEGQWQTLQQQIAASQETLRDFRLPSRPALSRYLQSYAAHFHKHYPLIHLPTFCPVSSSLWLTLSMAAVGAQCVFEPRNGYRLYSAARSLTLEQRKLDSLDRAQASPQEHRTVMIQTLVLLMVYSAWDTNTELLSEALDLQSVVAGYIRNSLRYPSLADDASSGWRQWIREETHRRVILLAHAYLVVQCTAYDLPPVVVNSEIQDLQLPCGSELWETGSEQEWREAFQRSRYSAVPVGDVLRQLLHQTPESEWKVLRFSAMGSFVVLQALIQRIFFARQFHDMARTALPRAELDVLQ